MVWPSKRATIQKKPTVREKGRLIRLIQSRNCLSSILSIVSNVLCQVPFSLNSYLRRNSPSRFFIPFLPELWIFSDQFPRLGRLSARLFARYPSCERIVPNLWLLQRIRILDNGYASRMGEPFIGFDALKSWKMELIA